MRIAAWLLVALTSNTAVAQSPWSGVVSAGYATGLDNGDFGSGSYAVTGGVFRQIGRITALGLEVGYQQYENRTEPNLIDFDSRKITASERHVAALLRVRSPAGKWRPYAVGGLGVYGFRESGNNFTAPGGQLGGGVELHPNGGALGVGLGVRVHVGATISDSELASSGFLTLMLSLAYQ
jgi:hypothetical protein